MSDELKACQPFYAQNGWVITDIHVANEAELALIERIKRAESERDRAEAMVARLIEAGKNAFERDGGGYERGGWHALVTEWQKEQK